MAIGLSFFSFSNYVKIACSSARFPNFLRGETSEHHTYHLKRTLTSGLQPRIISIASDAPAAGEAHFGCLHPRSCSFGHYPKLMTIGEGRNVDRLVNRDLCLSAQLPFHPSRVRITADAAPIRLAISRSILPSLVNKTPRYLNSSTWGRISSPTRRVHSTLFRLRTMDLDLKVLIPVQ